MAAESGERYRTARELGDEVERWLADEPVSAYREPVATRLRRWGRRNRGVVAGGLTLLVASVLGLAVGLWAVNAERVRTGAALDRAVKAEEDATQNLEQAEANLVLAKEAAGAIQSAGGGSIVAISSLGADRVFGAYAAFGVSKAAIEQLVRYLAVEYGPVGIRANCVSGGIVLTDLFKAIPGWEDIAAAGAERSPLGTVLDPENIADAVTFFASDAASRITGQTLTVDAGYLLPG